MPGLPVQHRGSCFVYRNKHRSFSQTFDILSDPEVRAVFYGGGKMGWAWKLIDVFWKIAFYVPDFRPLFFFPFFFLLFTEMRWTETMVRHQACTLRIRINRKPTICTFRRYSRSFSSSSLFISSSFLNSSTTSAICLYWNELSRVFIRSVCCTHLVG